MGGPFPMMGVPFRAYGCPFPGPDDGCPFPGPGPSLSGPHFPGQLQGLKRTMPDFVIVPQNYPSSSILAGYRPRSWGLKCEVHLI
jgi:hypothetical protein